MNKRLLVWGHKKIAIQNYALQRVCRDSLVNIMLSWALVVLIIGCVVVYGISGGARQDRPTEARRRRPF
jgi:hypothetical protein